MGPMGAAFLDLFPTLVMVEDIPHDQCNPANIVIDVTRLREFDPTGVTRSNLSGGWHSIDIMPKPGTELWRLIEALKGPVQRFGECLGYGNMKLAMGNLWAVVSPPGAQNVRHCHAGMFISGVYYAQVGGGASDLTFHDPRDAKVFSDPPDRAPGLYADQTRNITPMPGRVVLFPSWLNHSVAPNASPVDRISVSFNLNIVRQ